MKYILSAVLLSMPLMVVAQSETDTIVHLDAARQNKELTMQKEVLGDSIKKWGKELKALKQQEEENTKTIKQLQEQLARFKDDADYLEVCGLLKRKEELLAVLEEQEKEVHSLQTQLQAINGDLCTMQQQYARLDSVRGSIAGQVIANNEDYLQLPFSQMSLDKLDKIIRENEKYQDDRSVAKLLAQAKVVERNKRAYDEMELAANSRFDKDNINCLLRADPLKGLNEVQQKEVAEVLRQLRLFEDGLGVFKELIGKMQECRKNVNCYSKDYFDHDKKGLLKKRQGRITETVEQVPYLEKCLATINLPNIVQ
uniref:hypothetical protein n=1 Tax=Prevotella sp. TaxID=59823 RepID=UPI004024C8FA